MSKKKKKNKSVKILPISIIIFIVLSLLALYIILNKGKIAGYSLVKIDTLSESEEITDSEQEVSSTIELLVEQKYLSIKSKEETKIIVLIDGEEVEDLSDIEITSSNEDVIEVEDGVAKAIAVGKSTITATKGDMTATTDIRGIIPMTSMTFTATNTVVRVDKSLQMKLVTTPSDASIEPFKFESSDESIATVNANGIVTGVAPGKVTITVTDTYSDTSKSVNLTIKN